MNDSSSSSSNTEMNGQLSFEDMKTASDVSVSVAEILGLIHALVAILENHLE